MSADWKTMKVFGRDEVLADIKRRAQERAEIVFEDVKNFMNDFEVDIYRIIIAIGKHYGMDVAYGIMNETVVEKRMRWLEQAWPSLNLTGSEVEKGFQFYVLAYLKCKEGDYEIVEKTDKHIIFKRKEFVNAITHTCKVLGLDVIEVQNKVYSRATDVQFARINPKLRHLVLDYSYETAWYTEKVELVD